MLQFQISDVAWAPLALRIPIWLLSLRARNASVVSVARAGSSVNYALTTLVLDDNALALDWQQSSIGEILSLADTLQVLSCERCGLQLGVTQLIPVTGTMVRIVLQELHVAQVGRTQGKYRVWGAAGALARPTRECRIDATCVSCVRVSVRLSRTD